MADDKEKVPTEATTSSPPKTGGRKYVYLGKVPTNTNAVLQLDTVRIKPWSMTDDEIDKLLARRPDLARLWKKS